MNLPNNYLRVQRFERNNDGFSMIELIIVMLVLSILAVLSIMSFRSKELYLAEREALMVVDLLNEAKQRALTQHETMRIEINKTQNKAILINENAAGNAADDQVIRTIPLQHPNHVAFEVAPTNIANSPIEPSPVPAITFSPSFHPLSLSQEVATLRFTQTGTVLNGGSNSIGANAVMTGATIYFWMPNYSDTGAAQPTGNIVRAVTVLGSTGTTKFWKCPMVENQCTAWEQ